MRQPPDDNEPNDPIHEKEKGEELVDRALYEAIQFEPRRQLMQSSPRAVSQTPENMIKSIVMHPRKHFKKYLDELMDLGVAGKEGLICFFRPGQDDFGYEVDVEEYAQAI